MALAVRGRRRRSPVSNVLVLIVQCFGKVPALKDLPPSSPAFVQLTVLTLFIVGGVLAVRRFRGLSVQPS